VKGQRFSALYVRDFRLFWFGQVISLSGTWMHSVAQSWLVYSLTRSPLYLGIIASLSSLPILFLSIFGGMVADRYPKRNILIITQIMSIIPALVIAILTDKNLITIWHLGVTATFLGIVNAFDLPARQAFLGEVVSKGDITNAIALNSTAFNGARIIGPLIAGFIISHIGIPACFYINAISFIPVILALSRIEARGVMKAYKGNILSDITDSWRFIIREKSIFYILFLIAIFSLFGIPYITLLPVLASDVLKEGVRGLSFLVASAGAGSFTGALMIALKGEIRRTDIYLIIAAIVFSFGIFLVPYSRNLYLSMFFIYFAGWGIVSFLATSNSFIQHTVTDAIRGRVMSLYTLVFLGFAPIGNSVIGFSAHKIGTVLSLKLFALLCIAGSLLFWRLFKIHQNNIEILKEAQ
jgi:MFS family permease